VDQGTRVRFTIGPLGLTEDPDSVWAVEQKVEVGDEGTYLRPVEGDTLLKDWHIVQVGELYCPVHISMFEEVG
jgi:hypothetical protein